MLKLLSAIIGKKPKKEGLSLPLLSFTINNTSNNSYSAPPTKEEKRKQKFYSNIAIK